MNWYAWLDSEGKISGIASGPLPEEGDFVEVDLSSDLYSEFYYRMPDWARLVYLPAIPE